MCDTAPDAVDGDARKVGSVTSNAGRIDVATIHLAAPARPLEPGKCRDLALWDVEGLAELVHHLGANSLQTCIFRGMSR
jgi:hypothetical protein